jgi:hypothetical protein
MGTVQEAWHVRFLKLTNAIALASTVSYDVNPSL